MQGGHVTKQGPGRMVASCREDMKRGLALPAVLLALSTVKVILEMLSAKLTVRIKGKCTA